MGSPRATETTINLNCLGLSQRGRKKNGEWGAFSPLCALPERSRNKGLLFFSKRINSPWRISQRCFQQTTARSHLHWRLRHEMIIIQMQDIVSNFPLLPFLLVPVTLCSGSLVTRQFASSNFFLDSSRF
ncbi:hypothetical protein LSTR_LSTR010168 [Laodelphax striatellus]|uniref:Uncharacterized protein n=1 Tax=Laodelphax striatellus TaxID=195883 RepID=A0A482WJT2_LAOST|nr:hypothetical protein LSTR_LSTR010168 [Laodelphax striatellus]